MDPEVSQVLGAELKPSLTEPWFPNTMYLALQPKFSQSRLGS